MRLPIIAASALLIGACVSEGKDHVTGTINEEAQRIAEEYARGDVLLNFGNYAGTYPKCSALISKSSPFFLLGRDGKKYLVSLSIRFGTPKEIAPEVPAPARESRTLLLYRIEVIEPNQSNVRHGLDGARWDIGYVGLNSGQNGELGWEGGGRECSIR